MNDSLKFVNRKCPVCQRNVGNVIYHIDMHLPDGVFLPEQYDVVSCTNCGFTYADVNATQETYNTYYRQCNLYSESTALKSEFDEEINKQRYDLIKKYICKDSYIIDLGCGNGSMLAYLKMQGYQYLTGIDPSEQSIDVLKQNGIQGCVGNIFDEVNPNLKGKFDAVICTAVIEHIYDLNKFMLQCQQYLNFQGSIIVEAPNVESFARYIRDIPNYFNHEHINYFSLCSLDNLFLKYGFKRESPEMDCRKTICKKLWKEEILIAVYRKNVNNQVTIKKDDVSSRAICDYLNQEKDVLKQRCSQLRNYIGRYQQVIVWGTGALAMQMIADIPEMIEKTMYFVDNNTIKYSMKFCGKPIYPPNQLMKENTLCPIIILSMMNAEDIVKQIHDMNIENDYYLIK